MSGPTENHTMANGSWAAKTDSEYGKELKMTLTWDNGKITKHGGMECIIGQMVINMKVNGERPLKMVKVRISSQTKTSTLVFTKMVSLMATVNTNGAKVPPTSVSL
jgi:hypothetical protein